MRIVIAGSGKLGSMLARTVSAEYHDVTVIDEDQAALDRMEDLDVLPVKGNAVSINSLEEADIKHADILVATMRSDESNMLCCLISKRLGAKYTIARIRDPEYLKSMSFVTQELGIDYVANPERATAREIGRMLRFPFTASGVETFARGLVEMVEMRVNGDEPFVGIPLSEYFRNRTANLRVLFCGIMRQGQAIIPKGDFIIREGDNIFVCADYASITSFFRILGKNTKAAKDAMIVGGSRIGFYLCNILEEAGVKTKLIEQNEEKARHLDELLRSTTVICGDGTDQEMLLSEGLKTTDAFVALTDRDEENLMAGLYATHSSNARIIVKSNRLNYSQLLTEMGLESIISPSQIACNIILRAIRARIAGEKSGVERMYRIMDGQAEALEFIVKEGESYLGKTLNDLNVDPDTIVAVIVRGNRVIVPFGGDVIEAGDRVVIMTKRQGVASLGDVLKQ